jgi:hypothetical protein
MIYRKKAEDYWRDIQLGTTADPVTILEKALKEAHEAGRYLAYRDFRGDLGRIRLASIFDRVRADVIARAFRWFVGWTWRLPFVVVTRKNLEGWTDQVVDHAVWRTARVFRGEEAP